MKVTKKEFQDKIDKDAPKPLSPYGYDYYKDINLNSGSRVLYAFADPLIKDFIKWDEVTKHAVAKYVWRDGNVTKDSTGLFALLSNKTYAYLSNGVPIEYTWIDHGFDPGLKITLEAKCECGAHKVDSTQHSSWCQMKESG